MARARDLVLAYARNLKPKDFKLKSENFSSTRKGKRQYLNDKMQREFLKTIEAYFITKVSIPRIKMGKRQEVETLISEEAFLFARYLRGERPTWRPRIVAFS